MNLQQHRFGIIILIFITFLILPLHILAQGQPPSIPHPLKNYHGCLVCHETGIAEAPQIPDDHSGRTNVICLDCHLEGSTQPPAPPIDASAAPAVPHSLEGRLNCFSCHTSPEAVNIETVGGAPVIPHTLIGRENCLACHETGVGGAPQFPDDHAGRTSDICQACHQPTQAESSSNETPAAGPIPTPVLRAPASDKDSCVDCHARVDEKQIGITHEWQQSIHAERQVSCADCHGGNPAADTIDGAMNPDAGYVGAPAKRDIPALCASCHADVKLMRQYNLPTDQWAKYRESVHGIRLARGDKNVATCADCHGHHGVRKANDPSSTVYPANVPATCAACHADPRRMAPYGIPTNQYDLFRQSVHGQALLEKQDFRAPNCATCHGTHGAAPPGFSEVSNVCGSCHTATQDYYLKSAHASLENGPKCVTCHGRYDVGKADAGIYLGEEPRHCGSCHPQDSPGGQAAQTLYIAITSASAASEQAEADIVAARRLGMLMTVEEAQLREANTNLITAKAVQHTLNLDTVTEKTDAALTLAEKIEESADQAFSESLFRRQAMLVAVVIIFLVIVALVLIKRELDARLDDE